MHKMLELDARLGMFVADPGTLACYCKPIDDLAWRCIAWGHAHRYHLSRSLGTVGVYQGTWVR